MNLIKTQRYLALIIVTLLTLILASCGGSSSPTTTEGGGTGDGGTGGGNTPAVTLNLEIQAVEATPVVAVCDPNDPGNLTSGATLNNGDSIFHFVDADGNSCISVSPAGTNFLDVFKASFFGNARGSQLLADTTNFGGTGTGISVAVVDFFGAAPSASLEGFTHGEFVSAIIGSGLAATTFDDVSLDPPPALPTGTTINQCGINSANFDCDLDAIAPDATLSQVTLAAGATSVEADDIGNILAGTANIVNISLSVPSEDILQADRINIQSNFDDIVADNPDAANSIYIIASGNDGEDDTNPNLLASLFANNATLQNNIIVVSGDQTLTFTVTARSQTFVYSSGRYTTLTQNQIDSEEALGGGCGTSWSTARVSGYLARHLSTVGLPADIATAIPTFIAVYNAITANIQSECMRP